jgi:hypothetical protein
LNPRAIIASDMGADHSSAHHSSAANDIVGHIIMLIPPEDGDTVVAMSCVCAGWRGLFAQWLAMNNIVDIRGRAPDAEVDLCDRMHGSFARRMSGHDQLLLEGGIRASVDIDRSDKYDEIVKCVCRFGRLVRWTRGQYIFGFGDTVAGVQVKVMICEWQNWIGSERGNNIGGYEISLMLYLRASSVRFNVPPIRSERYNRYGWHRRLLRDSMLTGDQTCAFETVRAADLDAFLTPYRDRVIKLWHEQTARLDQWYIDEMCGRGVRI